MMAREVCTSTKERSKSRNDMGSSKSRNDADTENNAAGGLCFASLDQTTFTLENQYSALEGSYLVPKSIPQARNYYS